MPRAYSYRYSCTQYGSPQARTAVPVDLDVEWPRETAAFSCWLFHPPSSVSWRCEETKF